MSGPARLGPYMHFVFELSWNRIQNFKETNFQTLNKCETAIAAARLRKAWKISLNTKLNNWNNGPLKQRCKNSDKIAIHNAELKQHQMILGLSFAYHELLPSVFYLALIYDMKK